MKTKMSLLYIGILFVIIASEFIVRSFNLSFGDCFLEYYRANDLCDWVIHKRTMDITAIGIIFLAVLIFVAVKLILELKKKRK